MDIVERCPECGAFIKGTPAYETASRQVVKKGARFATKKVLLYFASIIISNAIFPIFGTVFGFLIAFLICLYIEKAADQAGESVALNAFDSTPFDFKCSHCGCSWKRIYEKGIDITTDSVLKWQKDNLVEKFKSKALHSCIIAIIAGIICFPCARYCFSDHTNLSNYLLWWILFIIGVPAFIIAISHAVKSINKFLEANDLEEMPIARFRKSKYRAGNPFIGKVKKNEDEDRLLKTHTVNEASSSNLNDVVSKSDPNGQLNKIDQLQNVKLLLDFGTITLEEYNRRKNKILTSEKIPIWTPHTKIDILLKLKSLVGKNVILQEEYENIKNRLLIKEELESEEYNDINLNCKDDNKRQSSISSGKISSEKGSSFGRAKKTVKRLSQKDFLGIFFILLLICCPGIIILLMKSYSVSVSDDESIFKVDTIELEGTINNKIGFTMSLIVNDINVEGIEHYNSQRDGLNLVVKGNIDNETMILHEYDGETKAGFFEGVIKGKTYSGTFTNSSGKSFSFSTNILGL